MPHLDKDRRSGLAITLGALVALVTLAVYIPTLGNGFINWDDPEYVQQNLNIRSLDLGFFKWVFTSTVSGNWHPLTIFSHALDYAVWGPNPLGHHLTNIVLHGVNTLLVALVAFKLTTRNGLSKLGPGSITTGVAAALLFGLHPLHVESVAWIAERKDVLSALFFLLSILGYLRYVSGRVNGSVKNCGYGASLVFFALALMSKPMAISLPFVLLIIDYYPLERLSAKGGSTARAVVEKLPFFALAVASGIVTLTTQSSAIKSFEALSLIERLAGALRGYAFYLYKTVAPAELAPIYPTPFKNELFNLWFFVALAVCIAISVFSIYMAVNRKRRRRLFLAVWLYYLITLGPVIGVVQVGLQAAADRYMYLPSLGPFMLIALGAGWLFTEKRTASSMVRARTVVIGAGIIISALMGYKTVRQTDIWTDSVTFWNYEIGLYSDRVPTAYISRGAALHDAGDLEGAMDDYNTAVSLNPESVNAYAGRGYVFVRLNNFGSAIEDYNMAISLKPELAPNYAKRAFAFKRLGDYARAMDDYNRSISLKPDFARTYAERGRAAQEQGDFAGAIADFDTAITLSPVNASFYYDRGLTYAMSRRIEPAIRDFTEAIELAPDFVKAYYDRAIAYSIIGRHTETIKDLNVAIELNPWFAYAYHNRGIAYANLGKFTTAIEDITRAIELDPGDAEFYRNRGRAYARAGNAELAARDYEAAGRLR